MSSSSTRWRTANPEAAKRIRDRAYAKAKSTKEGMDKIRAWNRGYLARIRDAAFMAYGGYKCACCGETERHFLSLDHVNNDGHLHRRMLTPTRGSRGSGAAFFAWLKKHNYPSGLLQVLCMNCNCGKHRNGGICPHQSKG